MAITDKTSRDAPTLDEQQLLQYLRSHPDFFRRHPAVLSELNLPHESGRAISLIERQVAVLRERNMTMRRRMNELLQAARDNDELFYKTRTLTLALLDVESWHELNEVLATNMLVDFEADFVCCHVAGWPVSHDHITSHADSLPTDRFVPGRAPVCQTLRPEEMTALFPIAEHETHGSVVLMPLKLSDHQGCLAVGSRDATRFSADMDTLFVTYIGDVLSRVLSRLLQGRD